MAAIKIKGMHCQHCVGSVKETLEKIEGLADVEVDLDSGTATFTGEADPGLLKDAIDSIGFEVVD